MQHAHALARFAVGASLLFSGLATAAPITLDQAIQRADSRPLVGMANASAEVARHDAEQANLSAYNPQLSASAGPRFVAGERSIAFDIGLGHTFELGGKRDARRAVADAKIESADAEIVAARLRARIEAWRAFQVALVMRERVAMAKEAEQVASQVQTATTERQKVGFGTQLEINLTTSEVGRARHDRLDAERKYDAAVAELASAIGAGASETFEPEGQLVPPPVLATDVNALVARAMKERPEARVARASTNVARAEIRAADAQAVPDLSIGVTYAYERDPDATSQTILGSVGIGLPVFNRNQGARKAARSTSRRAEIELAWTSTEIEREVRVAISGYTRAREAVLGFDKEVNERLHENLELARASYTSGKIDYFQFNVVRRELLASRNAYLDAFEETVEAWSDVQQALGGEVKP
jgi:cobalt-zinc-cadmium efflux system outer membrane protein